MGLIKKNDYKISIVERATKRVVYTDVITTSSYVKAISMAEKIAAEKGLNNLLTYEIKVMEV